MICCELPLEWGWEGLEVCVFEFHPLKQGEIFFFQKKGKTYQIISFTYDPSNYPLYIGQGQVRQALVEVEVSTEIGSPGSRDGIDSRSIGTGGIVHR